MGVERKGVEKQIGDAMPGKVLNRVLLNATLLARSAGLLEVPVLHTEQYPQGLGSTHPTVAQALQGLAPPPAVASTDKFCGECGAARLSEARFCSGCGGKFA